MLRILFLIFITTLSSLALGADTPPTFFEPAPKDVSIYYLGEIFGKGLVPGGAETYLISDMFEIFNQVCLVVAMVIIIYTIIVGVLETAGQGQLLGERNSATWLPVRIMIGMALLVPKAGSGYVLAQSIVMWMALQGVAGADQIWNKALDYFIEGGSIVTAENQPPLYSSYMNKANLDKSYELEKVILVNATCVEAHNNTDAAELMGEYEVYQVANAQTGYYEYVHFGNPKAWDPTAGGDAGRECGYITVPSFVGTPEVVPLLYQIYNDAFYYMARGLRPVAKFLASEEGSNAEEWQNEFSNTQYEAVAFIEYLNAASYVTNPNQEPVNDNRQKLETLKEYGWILAGNYYMTLTSYKDERTGIPFIIDLNAFDTVKLPPQSAYDAYPQPLENAEYYWAPPAGDPRTDFSFSEWENLYVVPGYGDLSNEPVQTPNQPEFTYADMAYIESSLSRLGNMQHVGSATTNNKVNVNAEDRDPLYYLQMMTNFGKGTTGDPIQYAASYGGFLTETAIIIFGVAMIGFIAIAGISAASGPCAVATPVMTTLSLTLIATIAPLIFGIAAFMYVQGALLSVVLPLIPFIIFFVAAIGWFIATIEMIVSAPLVAVGLVFPETNQEIWGKAEPAFMMILNLFLRPSLIIIGFVAGMILTWIAIELLNTTFYFFIKDAARIENTLFGWLVVVMAYIGVLITVVEKTFSITTELPNKVLQILGDRTQAQPGAEAMLSGMKQGAEKGSGAISGVISAGGGVAEKGASKGIESRIAKKSQDDDAAKNKNLEGRSK